MPVDSQHPDYKKYSKLQAKCRTAVEGEESVKAKGAKYLPRLTDMEDDEYDAYVMRAMFYNASGRTVQGLSGAILRKEPAVAVPDGLRPLLNRLGCAGEPLREMLSNAADEILTTGREGYLLDAVSTSLPSVPGATQQPLPYVATYEAEAVINWKTRKVDDREILEMVVLMEENDSGEGDQYEKETNTEYRVLLLEPIFDELSQTFRPEYRQELYRKSERVEDDGSVRTEFDLIEVIVPRKLGGRSLTFIPFSFNNPTSTTTKTETPPLLDLVNVNYSHYRTSADLEHGRHFTALPTVVVSGVEKATNRRRIGSPVAWEFENPQAKASFLEFTGAGLGALADALGEKQELMAILGGRLLEPQKKASEAAATIRLRHGGESAALAEIAQNLGDAFSKLLRWAAYWQGLTQDPEDPEIFVKLNKDYYDSMLTPEYGTWLMLQVQGGHMSWDTYYFNLEKGEVYPEGWSMEKERARIKQNPPPPPEPDDEGSSDENEIQLEAEILGQ